MRVADRWQAYSLLDSGEGEKLEQWGEVRLARPDPQVIWGKLPQNAPLWQAAHARYTRSSKGGGSWSFAKPLPQKWKITYDLLLEQGGNSQKTVPLTFSITPTGFKHTGLFPEQAVNWDFVAQKVYAAVQSGRRVKALNLFAYTGGATLALAAAGAEVTHVDAAKGMVAWAKENAAFSGLAQKPIRWMVDDCEKFVAREQRRGNQYDILIMDPPSYGRGPGGEVWKLEEQIDRLITLCTGVLSPNPICVLLNSYTAGLNPGATAYLLGLRMQDFGGRVWADEIGLAAKNRLVLPCGSTAVWEVAK